MLNSKDFCTLYSSFYGEQIDSLEQLKYAVFDGHELFEFIKYVEMNLANGVEKSDSNCNIPHVIKSVCHYCGKSVKPVYDPELKADICPSCKAYWQTVL